MLIGWVDVIGDLVKNSYYYKVEHKRHRGTSLREPVRASKRAFVINLSQKIEKWFAEQLILNVNDALKAFFSRKMWQWDLY